MRPVARIAQSVEQGIENPRVLGSIPSPGTTYLETDALRRPFCFIKSISYPHPVVYYCPLKSTGSAPYLLVKKLVNSVRWDFYQHLHRRLVMRLTDIAVKNGFVE